jgi:hypothetical protein
MHILRGLRNKAKRHGPSPGRLGNAARGAVRTQFCEKNEESSPSLLQNPAE